MRTSALALLLVAGCVCRGGADRVAWDNGQTWENVRITAFRMNNGVPQFQIETTALTTPAGAGAGWFGGVKQAEFGAAAGPEKVLATAAPSAVGSSAGSARGLPAAPGASSSSGSESGSGYVPIEATVSSIVQGDMLQLGMGLRVRLLGVDTPETTDPKRPLEFFGGESYTNTKRMVENKKVRIEFDERRMDNFGNLLGYVYVLPENTFVNLEIVRKGFGHAWTGEPLSDAKAAQFREAEEQARSQQLGIWNVARRRAAVTYWQMGEIEPPAVSAASQVRTPSGSSGSSRTYSGTTGSSRGSRSGRGRSVTIDYRFQERPVPTFYGGQFGYGTATEYEVTPR
jgi:endonuclease YncB( thermonuclease family)